MGQLTAKQRAILDFEARGWHDAGRKLDAIRDEIGVSEISYYQQLNALVDREEALAYSPVLINRLLRQRQRVAVR